MKAVISNIFHSNPSPKDIRIFLGIWAVIFIIIASFGLYKGNGIKLWAIVCAIVCVGLMWIPRYVAFIYKVWILLGEMIGFVISRSVLFVLFFGIFTPIGIFFRIIGRDSLMRRYDTNAKSYFIARKSPPQSMKQQF